MEKDENYIPPTLDECIEAVRKINEGISSDEDKITNNARWLYILNRINFWNDMPIVTALINQEIKNKLSILDLNEVRNIIMSLSEEDKQEILELCKKK